MRPSKRVFLLGLLVAGLFLLGWNNGFSLFFRSGYAVMGLLVVSWLWVWLNLRHVAARLNVHPLRLQAGQEMVESIEISNGGRWPKLGLAVRIISNFPQVKEEAAVALPRMGTLRWQRNIPCRHRGYYSLGPIEVSCQDPIGLFRRSRYFGLPQPVLVYPALVELSPPLLPQTPFSGGGSLRPQAAGEQVGGIREYQPGDSFSHIHWPSSAKTGRLISKELEGETSQEAWLILDMEAGVQAGEGTESTQEYGIVLAASLARAFIRGGYSLGLATWDRELHLLSPAQSEAHFWQAMETLAIVQGQGVQPLAQLIQAVAPRCKPGSTVMVLTPAPAASWGTWMHLLQLSGARLAALNLEADSFKEGLSPPVHQRPPSSQGVPIYSVRRGQALAHVFRQEAAA